MTFKVEKFVPIPNEDLGRGKGYSDALRGLAERGDSVWLPCTYLGIAQSAQRVLGPGNYVIRKEGDGVRVWRR